jgi:hypothetical protein
MLTVEWRHLDLDDKTCTRCSKTGTALSQVLTELRQESKYRDVEVIFTETKLSAEQIQQSNMILLNGRPLEDILSDAKADENYCSSCSCLTGKEARCRTISYNDMVYEDIPVELIRMSVEMILRLNDEVSET